MGIFFADGGGMVKPVLAGVIEEIVFFFRFCGRSRRRGGDRSLILPVVFF